MPNLIEDVKRFSFRGRIYKRGRENTGKAFMETLKVGDVLLFKDESLAEILGVSDYIREGKELRYKVLLNDFCNKTHLRVFTKWGNWHKLEAKGPIAFDEIIGKLEPYLGEGVHCISMSTPQFKPAMKDLWDGVFVEPKEYCEKLLATGSTLPGYELDEVERIENLSEKRWKDLYLGEWNTASKTSKEELVAVQYVGTFSEPPTISKEFNGGVLPPGGSPSNLEDVALIRFNEKYSSDKVLFLPVTISPIEGVFKDKEYLPRWKLTFSGISSIEVDDLPSEEEVKGLAKLEVFNHLFHNGLRVPEGFKGNQFSRTNGRVDVAFHYEELKDLIIEAAKPEYD